jgi:hypothetical protein
MKKVIGDSVEVLDKKPGKPLNRFTNWKFITGFISIIIVIILGGLSYYQANYFNANTSINDISVGGMTAEQALNRLKTSILKNEVYVGQQQILDGKDTQFGFSKKDLPEIKKLLKSQWTFFPSKKAKDYSLLPGKQDEYRSVSLKNELEQKLISMNQSLKAPTDAQALLEQGEIVVSPSVNGEQYDVESLLKDYQKQKYSSEIHLQPVYLQPLKEDSEIVINQKKKLEELLQQTVDYKIQDQVYSLTASDLIKNASVTNVMNVVIDPSNIKSKITEINDAQSTLNKNFTFTTHSGSVISVKGQGYGWALDVEKETALIKEAFEKGELSASASNIYGNGWGSVPLGYETTANNGIGNSYIEVSIAEQKIWLYKEGQLVFTTNVVTGKHSTREDTSPGVWYILYKKSPYTLRGSAVGKPNYSADVNYWAPFTNSGQGFHDASWRGNWAGNAYLTDGSAGCVNIPPSVMKTVYDNLSVNEPVVVY